MANQKILNRNIENATKGKGIKWMADAKRLSTRPGEDVSSTFQLPSHLVRNLTAKESAEEIANFVSKISQRFTPIEDDVLPEFIATRLENDNCEHPSIREDEEIQKD